LITFLVGYVLLIINPEWKLESKLWMVGVLVCFTLYSYLSDKYQQKIKIFTRYSRHLFILSFYAAVFSTLSYIFIPWPELNFTEYFYAFLFGAIFIAIPYYIYFHLIKKFKDLGFISFQLIGTVFVPLITEIIFLGIIPSLSKISSIIIIISSIIFLSAIYEKIKNQLMGVGK
jgi:drug/metabolite transporter (DMT)-like permease